MDLGSIVSRNFFFSDPQILCAAVDGDKMTTGTLRHESIRVLRGHPRNDSKRAFLASDPKNKSIACPGDSGGGAVSRDNGRITLVGVLSQSLFIHTPPTKLMYFSELCTEQRSW